MFGLGLLLIKGYLMLRKIKGNIPHREGDPPYMQVVLGRMEGICIACTVSVIVWMCRGHKGK